MMESKPTFKDLIREQRKDPVAFLSARAHGFAEELKLPPGFIDEAIQQVVGALGEDWLREQWSTSGGGFRAALEGHPITQAFLRAISLLSSVLELGLYLKHWPSSGLDVFCPHSVNSPERLPH